MKQLAKAGAIFDRILGILMFLACAIFIFAMLLVCTDVVLRYALSSPILWATEVSEFILVGIVSLGMAWLLKEEGHVRVDFLLNRFELRAQALIIAITSALAAAAVLTITWYGLRETLSLMEGTIARESGALRIPKAYLLIPLATGCFLFFVQFVRRSYRYWKSWSQPKG